MSTTVSTFLMFAGAQNGKAEEAITLYTRLFENSGIVSISKYGPGEQGVEGTVKHATFTLNGAKFMAIDGGTGHAFGFTPAISLFVELGTEQKLDEAFATLNKGGQIMMPLDAYPFSRKFAWLADRYGISWQLSLV